MVITPNSSKLFTSDMTGSMKLWNTSDGKLLRDFGCIHVDAINSISMTPNGRYLYTSDKSGYLKKWSLKNLAVENHYCDVHATGIVAMTATH